MIRYRRSPGCKPYKFEIVWNHIEDLYSIPEKSQIFVFLGEYIRKNET